MNSINVQQIKPNSFFTKDSFILDDLFFMPKNTMCKEYHLNILQNWKIDSISTEGELHETTDSTISNENETDEKKESGDFLEDVFSSDNMVLGEEPINAEKISESIDKASHIKVEDSFKEIYKRWIVTIINFFNEVLANKNIDKQKVINLLQDIEQFTTKDQNQVFMLFGERFEGINNIFLQTIETVILAISFSGVLQLADFAKTNLIVGTLFHDLGMLKVPKAVIEKKGVLSNEDILAIQNHTVTGFKYLREVKYSAIIASGALQHHERVDGKGYPAKINSEKITQIGKIVAVIDAYCAAISSKPFRDPLHAKEAVQDLLKKGGTLYDSGVLRDFVKIISFYPIGSLVLLSNELPAKVVGTSGVAMRPVVKIVSHTNQEIIDLSQRNDLYIKGVYRAKK